jgi:Asp-tRNA(Asn)/Glu-tRNA(Gln) amidotransferase A subunit family amidase
MSEPCLLSALELSNLLSKGDITADELAKSYLKRIEKFEKDVKAWAFFDPNFVLKKASECDNLKNIGRPIGPLHGIPIAIKDIFGTDEMPTECGTILRKKRYSKGDSTVVSLLKSSGAYVMGKTVTTEFAYFDPGKTTNPHDYNRTPGGSSSGSAAAVASFMTPVAIGSQTNGSVIRPASYCGVLGYKPSYGLISRNGVLRQSFLLDHVGIFSRTVDDLAFISQEIIKRDTEDRSTVQFASGNFLNIAKEDPPFDPRFIFFKTDMWKNLDKETIKIFEKFIKEQGSNVEVHDTPSYFKDIIKYHKIIHETDMAYAFSDYYKNSKNKLGKELVKAIERGQNYKSRDYVEAVENRDYFYKIFSEVFNDYHGILTPASSGVAPKGLKSTGSPEFSTIWTFLGMPSISLPLLSGSNNLPLGVQLVGEKFDDARLMRTANWIMKKNKNV